jgi:hypothetical protein
MYHQHIKFIEGLLGVLPADANGLGQMLRNLRLRHPNLHGPSTLDRMAVMANPYRLTGRYDC